MQILDMERQAYIAGDIERSEILGLVIDAEAERDAALRGEEEATREAIGLKKVLQMVVDAAENFVLDSEMDAAAIKVLLNVLDNAKDSL